MSFSIDLRDVWNVASRRLNKSRKSGETGMPIQTDSDKPLGCLCGCRRLLRTEVLGQDGNPWTGDWPEVFQCPACGRAWELTSEGEFVAAIVHASIQAWRKV